MASSKKRLQDALRPSTVETVQQPEQREESYELSIHRPADEMLLSPEAGTLNEQLQEIARLYVGARRRSGEALLEAARWLSEARRIADHGEWKVFIEATGTSEATALRLLNTHNLVMRNPQVRELVARDWISPSVAALLARPSTPPEVIEEVIESDIPPRVADVQNAIRKVRQQIDKPYGKRTKTAHSEEQTEAPPSQEYAETPYVESVEKLHFAGSVYHSEEPEPYIVNVEPTNSSNVVQQAPPALLSDAERVVIDSLVSKTRYLLADTTQVNQDDWNALAPLAECLSSLHQRLSGEAEEQRSD